MSSRPEKSIWRRIALWPAEALVALYVVLDDVVTPILRPVVRWAAAFPLILRLQLLAEELPPYGVLGLMAVPFVLGEPAKLYGLYLVATGHLITGAIVVGLAHLAILLLVERLYVAGKAKLRTIRWFAFVMDWLIAVRDRIHEWAKSTSIWAAAEKIARYIRETYPIAKRRVLDAIEWLRLRRG